MPLAHLVRITCHHCRAAVIMDAALEFVYGEIEAVPALVNDWRRDNDGKYFCGPCCEQSGSTCATVHRSEGP